MLLTIQHVNINAADAPKLMTYQGHLHANEPAGQDAPQNKTIVFIYTMLRRVILYGERANSYS